MRSSQKEMKAQTTRKKKPSSQPHHLFKSYSNLPKVWYSRLDGSQSHSEAPTFACTNS